MSTPKNPGPRLPEKPAGPPSVAQDATAAEPPSDTASVLERLKAARPRTVAPVDDDASASGAGPAGGTAKAAAGTGGAKGARNPGAGTTGQHHEGVGGAPGSTDEPQHANDADVPARRRLTAQRAKNEAGTPRDSNDADVPARRRLTAQRAKIAAASTGRALGRGSSVVVRRIGAWDPDIVRQSVVTLCAVACIIGSAAGVGAFGGPSIRDAAGGLFAPDATLLAPSSSAFSIWSVIYAGLVAYTLYQWLPSQRRSVRQRRLGWMVAASMLLNLAWILSAQEGLLTLSLVVIMLLFFALLAAVHTMNEHPNRTRLEGALVDTPIGLYLGWVLLAAAANAAAFFTETGADLFGWRGETWAVVGIIAVLMTAAIVCSTDRGRLSVAAATSWGLLWIAVERIVGEPGSFNVAFAAALSVFLLLITAGSRRHRVDHAYRRWLRAQQDAQREPLDLLGEDGYEDSRP